MTTAKRGTFNYQILEKEYAKFVGSDFAVSVNSGTAALHLALVALGIGKGDEVIVPDFTMAACGFAVSYTGAKVVTVDCKDDLTIDPALIEAKINKRTKAIMPVHIYGRLCDMKAIVAIAEKRGLYVVEDACEAQGAVKNSKATVTCYSFFKNKIIAAEEGGIVTTDNPDLAERMRYLKNMAFDLEHTYFHTDIGFNYRMPEAEAALALQSLRKYKENAKKRRQIEEWYNEFAPKPYQMPERDAVWVYDIKHPFKDDVLTRLPNARHFFKPLSSMPMWKQISGPRAKFFGTQGMYLPVTPQMTKKDVQHICALI